jgi:ectoine hydroxylase-related dioxygenase (phytanoyl-CoA dioxygenase family)
MLTSEQTETLLEIQRNPKNINIDSRVSSLVLRLLLNKGYISKSKPFRSTDGQTMFDYIVTAKGIEAYENRF